VTASNLPGGKVKITKVTKDWNATDELVKGGAVASQGEFGGQSQTVEIVTAASADAALATAWAAFKDSAGAYTVTASNLPGGKVKITKVTKDWNATDEIVKGGETATVTVNGWHGVSVAVVSGTNALTVANATWTAMKDETGAYAAGASLLPGGKARAIKQYDFNPNRRRITGPYYVVNGNTTQGSSRTKIDGGVVKVLVKSVTSYDGTRWKVRLSAMRCINRSFTLRINTAGKTLPEFTAKIGLVNSDAFLGLPIGTCMYNGVSYSSVWSDEDKEYKEQLGYVFSACSLGFATVEEDDFILTSTNPGTVGDTGALMTASSFCASVEKPDSTSFAEFLTV